MNKVLKQIKSRKSVRIFKNKTVKEKTKNMILQAAFEAPTAGCMMLYQILDITDPVLKKKLSVTCDNQPFIADAPLILIFIADCKRWYDIFKFEGCEPRLPGEGDLLLAAADAVIAAQNTVAASESLGMGSCYIGDILENAEEVKKLLKLPDHVFPAAMLVYGYPVKSQKKRKKPVRFDRKFLVSENSYKSITKEDHIEMQELRNIKAGKADRDITKYIHAFCKRKYMSDFSLEMNRSASAYLENFRFSSEGDQE